MTDSYMDVAERREFDITLECANVRIIFCMAHGIHHVNTANVEGCHIKRML